MKKILSAILCVMLLLTGCGKADVIQGNKDTTPNPSQSAEASATPALQNTDNKNMLSFTTMTLDGKGVTLADYSENRLIMVNLWEPWCGPCVNEMPALNELYKNYKDKGFVILGVFADMDYKSDAKTIVKQNSIEYPILINTNEFSKYATEYVPTTVFFDGQGNLLSEEPYIGGRDYESWKSIIESFLNK